MENWRHNIPYQMDYLDTRTEDERRQEMEQERVSHDAEMRRWEAQMNEAASHRFPAGEPATLIQTENQPRALPQGFTVIRET